MLENGHLGGANLLRSGLLANRSELRHATKAPGIRTTSTKRFARYGPAVNDLLLLEGFHIFNAVNNPAPDLDVVRTYPQLAPAFERLVADLPSVREMIRVQVPHQVSIISHFPSP